jgi:F-box and WD-40 domain protein 1/11
MLGPHRAAVNAISISKNLIVSGSGDRSIRLWDAQTGVLLHKFEDHHTRGCETTPTPIILTADVGYIYI